MQQRPAAFFDTPVLRYAGAKWKLADWIASFFPDHDTYIEPFAGSGALFWRKHPSPIEVLNDLDGDVVNFYRMLRENGDALVQQIELTPFAREEYELCHEPCDDPLERARRFYVRCWQSFGSSFKSGWRFQVNLNRGTSITNEWRRNEGLYFAIQSLKDAQVTNEDALDCIRRWDTPRSLFYVDPPYLGTARSQGRSRRRYAVEMMDEATHRELAEVLNAIQGMAIVSGYASDLYTELFRGWDCHTKTATTNGQGHVTEHVWLSPKVSDALKLRRPEQQLLLI